MHWRKLLPWYHLDDGARLDIAARGLWSPREMAFFDTRVPHPEPNPTLITTPQQRCTVSIREKTTGNMETAVYTLKMEPAMTLYSRPPEVWAHSLPCFLND